MKIAKVALAVLSGIVVAGVVVTAFVGPPLVEKSMNKVTAHTPYEISEAAKAKHDQLVVVDWHSDSLLWDRNLLERSDYGHVDIPRLAEGNVAIQMFTAVTKSPSGQNLAKNTADSDNITLLALLQMWPPSTWSSLTERALYQARKLHELAAKAPERIRIIKSGSELKAALKRRQADKESGKTPLVLGVLGVEGAHALDGKLENIEVLFDAGYRMMGLHHFFDNKVGGSLHGVSGAGLTDFGRRVVRELDEREFIIDLVHTSPKIVEEMLEISQRPMVVSHTGMYGVCQTKRNISDELMKSIAAKGGIIAIGYWDGAACEISPAGVVRSIRYAVDLVGEDHVSLGSDYDGTTTVSFDTSELAVLTHEMINSGFSDSEIKKVMGDNAVRFLLDNLPENSR